MRDETEEERSRRIADSIWPKYRMPWSPPFLSVADRERLEAARLADLARGATAPERFDAEIERYLPDRAPDFRAFYGDGWNADESEEAYARRLAERAAAELKAWLEYAMAGCPPVALKSIRPRSAPESGRS